MELKTKYQYSYFIHPFVVKENKYQKYLQKLLRNKNFHLKLFQKEKDMGLYQYFLPKVSDFLFSSFSFSENKVNKLEELPIDTKSALLSKYPCTIFEYIGNEDIQGKAEENSIFFHIQKIELICFQTGICFFVMKTNIENSQDFADVLNFNYKFRDIPQEHGHLNGFDNIHLQTDTFSDISRLTDFIESITGSKVEMMKLDLDTKRFLTYSYVCVDQRVWNEQTNFENIEYHYTKFANFLPADNSVDFEEEPSITFSRWKFAKFSMSKQGVTLFASEADRNNYTVLPDQFEREYFYTYLLNLYKKIYMKKLEKDFQKGQDVAKVRKQFIEFTKNLWIQEITEEEEGSCFNHDLGKVFELDRLYLEIKNQYDVLYKEFNIERNSKFIRVLILLLGATLTVNILNYIALLR